ncbi:hypothetical protein D3C72_1679910 [compost metagenome]
MVALVRRPTRACGCRVDGVEHRHLHARIAQVLKQGIGRLDGANRIHHQRNLGAAVARGDQGFGKARAFRIVVKDIGFHVHVAASLRNGLQHGAIRTGPVSQQLDAVAGR